MAVDLSLSRQKLVDALGESATQYWNIMKLWYKQKISKEEFDVQARECLGSDNVHFHNEFLLAILARCQAKGSSASSSSTPRTPQKLPNKPTSQLKKTKVKSVSKRSFKADFEHRFQPYNPLTDVPPMGQKDLTEDSEIGLSAYQLTLPDAATVHGRLFLGAWDAGLESVSDDTVNLILLAVEQHMKDILTGCCSNRSTYRLRDGHFRYGMGSSYPKPSIKNAGFPLQESNGSMTVEQAEAEAAALVAGSDARPRPPPLSLFDLRDALQVHRRVIPSHTVYAANTERLLAKLWHPSNEELEQNQLHKLEARRRFDRLRQQRSLRL